MSGLLARHDPAAIALIDADRAVQITYGQLRDRIEQSAPCLQRERARGLVFHLTANTIDSIILYLACFESGCPVALLEPGLAGRFDPLVAAYRPDVVLLPEGIQQMPAGISGSASRVADAYQVGVRTDDHDRPVLQPDLALLLTTSGSTGSPKFVRLTRGNVLANARSIAAYLGIGPGERSMQTLPMHYSYGLSLVNSHLVSGATVVLTKHSFMRPEFWEAFDRSGCTSFAGVPYLYETLHRLRFDPARHPSLRTMTQAGGGLRPELIRSFHDQTRAAGCRFFVMYGQTEAAARISYVPCERLGEKIGSIGIAIPGGRLSLSPLADSDQQELVYCGPNVMMGYAESARDLAAGDRLQGTLRTGDLARVDDEGYYYLTGRLKRFAKLFGRRVNLADVEQELEALFPVAAAAIDRDGALAVYVASDEVVDLRAVEVYLARQLNVPPKFIRVSAVETMPLTASGKKDYEALPA